MTFEDRLKERFRRTDASIPGQPIDWNTTITKARRSRMRFAAFTAVAAASILGVGAYALTNLDTDPAPIGPAGEGSPSSEPTPTPIPTENRQVRGDCSAGDSQVVAYDWKTPELPDVVEDMRSQIIVAAIACDYDTLAALGLEGQQGFQYSYGVENSPSSFWRAREREARTRDQTFSEYMRYLVKILELPHCKETGPDGKHYFVWPRVHCNARTDSDWDDLEGLYTSEEIDQMRTGDIYYGFRVGILEDGDWVYFIAGD